MKNACRTAALLAALLTMQTMLALLFSLSGCGDAAKQAGGGQSGDAAGQTSDIPGDFDRHDSVFPGENVPKIDFHSLANYKTLRDLVKKGDGGAEALTFSKKSLKIAPALPGGDKSDRLQDPAQLEALVAETENVKILLPQSEDWTLSSFSRAGSIEVPDGNGGILDRPPYKKCLRFGYRHETFGYITFAVYYGDTRNRTPRQFYRYGTGDPGEYAYDYSRKYISPQPYFTLPLTGGETLTVFKLDEDSDEKGFLFTENSEITIGYSFQNDKGKPTLPTPAEKKKVLRDFFESAKVVTLGEAANSGK